MNAQKIIDYLVNLGFEKEEAKLYLSLSERGAMSILEASRITGIERTKLYRMVGELVGKGLIEEQMSFKSTFIRAVPADKVLGIIEKKENTIESAKLEYGIFKEEIEAVSEKFSPSKVLYFRGIDGVKQMQWNTLQAKNEMVSYVARAFQGAVGQNYLESYATAWRELGIKYRELKSETFELTIDSKNKLYPVDLGKSYKWKVAPKSVVNITHNTDIYNDVVAMYYWRGEEVFGVEIHNKEMALMQRSLFNLAWNSTTN
jgi:sugar-specific transcriptional regulator TrmB